MEEKLQTSTVVDPEVRAYVYSLVTALGGTGSDETGSYVLGDDALACLRDLKRWLKLYDEKTNHLDVARCLAEANLVNGDLLPILASWLEDGKEHRLKSKVALGCLELLVPLTWPMEMNEEMTVNHHRHMPYLLQAQVRYKRGILNWEDAKILRTIIRIGLPSMTIPRSDRTSRDEGIIKLVLYFLRNITVICPSLHLPVEGDENEVSRSATIEAFHEQEVFALLLTLASNMGEDFSFQDVPVMEILFHLLKGVSVEKLFMSEKQRKSATTGELRDILKKESSMNRDYLKTAPTRHGRFGTMIWVKRSNEKVSTVSGQDVLMNERATMQRMDETKKWNKPQQRNKNDKVSFESFDMPVRLSSSATRHLRVFVEEFLDSGFNPLFTHVRRAIEREADRVHDANYRQFFFLVSWFLEAERLRRLRQMEAHRKKNSGQDIEPDSYALVAGVLNQETFITLNRYMQNGYDNKEWQDLNASMRCFTQILLTVQEMAQSPLEDDQDIAENIQNRIFYEETTHDRIISILRGYKDQGFGYLDACIELSHVFLRLLERYSKENTELQVRSKRKARKKKTEKEKENKEQPNDNLEEENPDDGIDSEAEELAEAVRVSKERRFDFKRFSARFATQKCVDTFVAFTTYYKDLSPEQLKRAHRFFYRVAFKQEVTVILFRLDIISLFYKMIKGPGGLDSTGPTFKEWEELVRQLFKRLTRKLEDRPQLFVEILFSKIPATLHYLEYGEEKQTITSTKPPAELEVNPHGARTLSQKIAIVVGALAMDDKLALAKWVARVLRKAADERISWEEEVESRRANEANDNGNLMPGVFDPVRHPSTVIRADNDTTRTAMFKNAKLRLLMTLVGFERLGVEDEPSTPWIIPSSKSGMDLDRTYKTLDQAIQEPITQIDGYDPRAQLRHKRAEEEGAPRADFIDDSEGEGDSNAEEEFLFAPNPRSKRSKGDALEELKKKRRRKKREEEDGEDDEELDEETLEARRLARKQAALERRRKIKSEAYIHSSDDESDPEKDKEFFKREEERRLKNQRLILQALRTGEGLDDDGGGDGAGKKSKSKSKSNSNKRKLLPSGEDGREKKAKKRKGLDEEEKEEEEQENNDDDDIEGGAKDTTDEESDEDALFIRDKSSSSSSRRRSDSSAVLVVGHERTDTPLSSQQHHPDADGGDAEGDVDMKDAAAAAAAAAADGPPVDAQDDDNDNDGDGDGDDDDDDDQPVVVAQPKSRRKGFFFVESDSDDGDGDGDGEELK